MRREWLVGFLLVASVTFVYWPVHSYPFVLLDDPEYVFDNPYVNKGLKSEGVRYAFTSQTLSNWHPLTMLSHMLDCQWFGARQEDAGGHHMTNVFLHAANTLLLFIALRSMTGAVWRSGFAAALFGLHPLHVESVAWISERKDVLSTFFFMLLLIAYHHYARRPSVLRYLLVFVLLVAGLMSKPMLVTAPLVLLLLDYWPLGRLKFQPAAGGLADQAIGDDAAEEEAGEFSENDEAEEEDGEDIDDSSDVDVEDDAEGNVEDDERYDNEEEEATENATERAAVGPDYPSAMRTLGPFVAEKIPLFIPVALAALMALKIQSESGAMGMLGQSLTLVTRLENAICSYGLYMEKIFWPRPLAAIYPYTTHKLVDVLIIGVALVAISVAAYHLARIKPYLAVGWWWYLITLVPVIGIVQVGIQSMADRYTYIPSIGLFIIAAWGVGEMIDDLSPRGKAAAAVAAIAVLCVFSWLTRQQLATWSSSEALFSHAAAAEPNNFFALEGLGKVYWKEGRLDDARKQFEDILKIESDPHLHVQGGLEPAHRDLALLLAVESQYPKKPEERHALIKQALDELDKAIALQPKQPDARRHKAWLLATYPDDMRPNDKIRDGREALQLAQDAMKLCRGQPPAEFWDTLAAAHAETYDFKDAIDEEEKAIETAKRTHAGNLLKALEERLGRFKSSVRYHAWPQQPTRF